MKIPMTTIDRTAQGLAFSISILLCMQLAGGAVTDVEALKADSKFFTDGSCSELKTGVKQHDLAGFKCGLLKTVAAGLLDGTYDK